MRGGARVVGYVPLGWLGVRSMDREHVYILLCGGRYRARWLRVVGGSVKDRDLTEQSRISYALEEKHNKYSRILYIVI